MSTTETADHESLAYYPLYATPCLDKLSALDWAATSTFHLGRWAIGVRSSSAALDEALRAALADHVIDTVGDVPPNVSIRLPDDPGTGPARSLNLLHWTHADVVRSRGPHRVLEGLLHILFFRGQEPPTDALHVTALALEKDGRALIVPGQLRYELPTLAHRLRRLGIRVVDTPQVRIDLATGELVVPRLEDHISLDRAPLAPWLDQPVVDPPVPPGRYPVAAWALGRANDDELPGPLSRANGVLRAFSIITNQEGLGGHATLAGLGRAFAQARVVAMAVAPEEAAPLFASLLEG